MKIFIGLIESIIFLGLIYGLYVNWKAQTICGVSIGFEGHDKVFLTSIVILGCFLVGLFSGGLFSALSGKKYKDQLEFYARRSEKLSQQSEIEADD